MPNSLDNIQIRSEEVQEILGKPPARLIRVGITIVFLIIAGLLTGAWFFKYPDIITSKVVLTTQTPPAQLRAMTMGKITHIFFEENQYVEQNELIAIIENTANYRDVFYLESLLDTLTNVGTFQISASLQLGSMQQQYATFLRLVSDLKNFETLDASSKKINSIKKQIGDYKHYYEQQKTQSKLKHKDLLLANDQFNREKELFEGSVTSMSDYEKAEKQYLQEEIAYEDTKTSLSQIQIQISQLEQQIIELQLDETQERQSKIIAIAEAISTLQSLIESWKQSYLIVSPINGNVTFTQVWSRNHNVQEGSVVATVIPSVSTQIIGKTQLPSSGAGKVTPQQDVNIKLDNYPHMEFGMLKGKVKNISLVPTVSGNDVFYTAEIFIPDGMISNYNKALAFNQEMTGTADIITDDIRLLERLFNPLKAIFKQNIE